MKNKRMKQCLSILMIAAITLGSPGIPSLAVSAAPAEDAALLLESEDREINLNMDWKFHLNEAEGAENENFDDSAWEDIQLPHDFSIMQEFSNTYEAESGFLPGGTGWYRKKVVFPADYVNKSVILNFDGVYNNAYVYINGEKIGEHHYGYTNFSFDISDYITCNGSTENVIAVKAVNEFPSSRWYSGSGIYRDVTLTVVDPVHISLNGTYVTTPDLEAEKDGDVTVHVETKVQNDSNTDITATMRTTIQDAEGNTVSKAAISDTATITAGETAELTQEPIVNKPDLWDCDNPNLYYVKTEILSGDTVLDAYTTEFGFRYFDYSANTGFSLNGTNVKMKGVCLHHDQGALGAAAYRDAVYRQISILKEMGCNAIRTSHNAHAKILLEICNELGMLVMDEVYDGWSYAKNGNSYDFSKYFNQTLGADNHLVGGSEDEKWVQFALESFINRDKNDPCVVMWSIGNELPTGALGNASSSTIVNEFKENASNMISWIQAIDNTKPITHGDNLANFSSESDFRTQIDALLAESGGVVGLNYSPGRYVDNHNKHPDWPLVATETVSSINSRGIYNTIGQISETGNYQNTAYDTHAVSWGQLAKEAWLPVISNDFMSGTFVWTGFDYIGEPTDWNGTSAGSVSGDEKAVPNSSFFGIIDTAGFPKDSYYFYTSQWKEDATTLHIVPGCWNEDALVIDNTGFVRVDIYSNASKVDLLLNGTVIGTAERRSFHTDAGYEYAMYSTAASDTSKCRTNNTDSDTDYNNMAAQFYVKYEEGVLSAKAYDAKGREITDTIGIPSVTTNSDSGSSLSVMPEKTEIQADGSSLAYIDVDILDANGEFASQADNNIRFTLTGNGEIVGVDNGNPSTVDKFQQKSVLTDKKHANINAFSGKALIIVRSTKYSGGFSLRAESDGLGSKTVTIDTSGIDSGETYLKSYDLETEYSVLMGNSVQLQTNNINCIKSDGTTLNGSVEWDAIPEEYYNNPGDYQIHGIMSYGEEKTPVTAALHVQPVIVAAKNCSRATIQNVVPILPQTVSGILPDGRLYGAYPATWDSVPESDLSEVGNIVTVNGTAVISDDVTMPVKMTIRVAESTTETPKNVAPDCSSLTQNCNPASDNLNSIIDGNSSLEYGAASGNNRWTNYDSALLTGPAITFNWDEIQTIGHIDLYYFSNHEVYLPTGITFSYSDGTTTKTLTEKDFTATPIDTSNNKATYTFTQPLNAASLTIGLSQTEHHPPYVGIVECEIYNTGITYALNDTAVLNSLTINGKEVPDFNSTVYDGYSMKIDGRLVNAIIEAKTEDNASVTIIPIDSKGIARVVVQSEDSSRINTYEIEIQSDDEALNQMESRITEAFSKASDKVESNYTPASWQVFQTALKALQDAWANGTYSEVTSALNKFNTALANLKAPESSGGKDTENPSGNDNPKGNENNVSIGYVHKTNNAQYKVTSSTAAGGTVTFVKPLKKTNTKFVIPTTVVINSLNYKVTAISKSAFKNNKKLKKVTISNYVTNIGASAFSGDKKLKTIVIRSNVLKTVGKKAFNGISASAKIKVPKAKLKAYKKLLKGKGQKSSVKITK